MFKRLTVPVFINTLILAAATSTVARENHKKLIEWGWDEPDTKLMRQNGTKMEQLPLDGVVFHVNSSKVKLADLAADPEKYRQHFTAGFGIWLDCDWRGKGWHTDDLSKNFFSPAEFEASVRLGLARADEYVWIYTEQPRWWTNEKLPKEYIEALRKARSSEIKSKTVK